MLEGFLGAVDELSSAMRKAWHPRVSRRRRYAPQLEDVLERREVLSPFPFTGTFSGSYSVSAAYGGIGPGQEVSGTISVTIAATSTQSLGDGSYQAYITGSVSITGFLGQSATYPFGGDYNGQSNGIETESGSTGPEPSVQINISAYNPGSPLNYVSIVGSCTNNSIVSDVNIGMNGYSTPNPATVILAAGTSTPTPSQPGTNPKKPLKGQIEKVEWNYNNEIHQFLKTELMQPARILSSPTTSTPGSAIKSSTPSPRVAEAIVSAGPSSGRSRKRRISTMSIPSSTPWRNNPSTNSPRFPRASGATATRPRSRSTATMLPRAPRSVLGCEMRDCPGRVVWQM